MTIRSCYLLVAILPLTHFAFIFSSSVEVIEVPTFVEVLSGSLEDAMKFQRDLGKLIYKSSKLNSQLVPQFIASLQSYQDVITRCEPIMLQMLALISLFEAQEIIDEALEIINPATMKQILLGIRIFLEKPLAYNSLFRYCMSSPSIPFFGAADQFSLAALIYACIQNPRHSNTISNINREVVNKVLPYRLPVQQQYNGYLVAHTNCTDFFLCTFGMPNFRGYTKEQHSSPLHAASDCSHHRVMIILLRQGFDPEIKDLDGDTALDVAMRPPPSLTKEYEEKNAIRLQKGEEPFFRGLEYRKKSRLILKLFLKYSAKSDDGTPHIIKHILLATNTSAENPESKENQIIATVAIKLCPALVSSLIRDGAGNTLLHAAVIAKNPQLTKLILTNDTEKELRNSRNVDEKTPLDLVIDRNSWGTIGALASDGLQEKLSLLEKIILLDSEKGVQVIIEETSIWGEISWGNEIDAMIMLAFSKGKFRAIKGVVNAAYLLESKRLDAEKNSEKALAHIGTFLLPVTGIFAIVKSAWGLLANSK